ncbi:MAG: YCF48-related protein, partial [Bacteroidota bacterium]
MESVMSIRKSLTLLFQISCVVVRPALGQNQWQWQNPLPQGNSLYDMCFVDSSHGWAVGHGGTVMRTTNGGAYWQYVHTRFNRLFLKTSFVSRERGWVMTYQPYVVLRTTDGGLIWDSLSVLPGSVYYDLAFANDTLGFASGGNGQIARTTDGGARWSTSQVTSFGSILSIQCAGSDVAWGVTSPLTLRTTNGGQTWNEIWPPYPLNHGLGLQRIMCRNALEAAVVGNTYDVD